MKFRLWLLLASVGIVQAGMFLSLPVVEWPAVTKYSSGVDLQSWLTVQYRLYRSEDATNWILLGQTTNTWLTDTNAVPERVYYYRVSGEINHIESSPGPVMIFYAYPTMMPEAPQLR